VNRIARLMAAPFLVFAVAAFSPGTSPDAAPASIHFALSSSTPAAGSVGASPSELRLTFTEAPAAGTMSIRVVEAADAGAHVMDPVQDPEDPKTFVVAIHGTLRAGTYTVSWRGMGADGHVVRDDFQFTVQAR